VHSKGLPTDSAGRQLAQFFDISVLDGAVGQKRIGLNYNDEWKRNKAKRPRKAHQDSDT